MTFSSSGNNVTALNPETEPDPEVIQNWKNYVKNTFTVSTAILNKNYYAKFDYLFGDDVDPYSTYPPKDTTVDTDEVGGDDTSAVTDDTTAITETQN